MIEVQCQREYEGKGAYPNYAIKGVIDGFAELGTEKGLKDIIDHPKICGIYTWSRGGGWFGPYVTSQNELWCDLNAYVIAQYSLAPNRSEVDIFRDYCLKILKLSEEDAAIFRKVALLSLEAVVKGKCCAAWDREPSNRVTYPTNQWMRDDVLHGDERLGIVFDYLISSGTLDEALEEKEASVVVWKRMRALCEEFSVEMDDHLRAVITASVEYGLRLFSAISQAWAALAADKIGARKTEVATQVEKFNDAWAHYEWLPDEYPTAGTLYRAVGWHWPGDPEVPGLKATMGVPYLNKRKDLHSIENRTHEKI